MKLSKWIRNQADSIPDKAAIFFDNKKISYSTLADLIDNYAYILKEELSLNRGDRVAYLGVNSPEFIALLFACARTGTIIIPLNWRLAEPEHIQLLKLSKPRVLFSENDFTDRFNDIQQQIDSITLINFGSEKENWKSFSQLTEKYKGQYLVSEVSDTNEDDAVLLCYTSGTTGEPKGAVLSKKAIKTNALNSLDMHGLTDQDTILTLLPMFHVGGLNIQTLPALSTGATVVLLSRFEIELFYQAFEQYPITLTLVVPTIMHALMSDPRWECMHKSHLKLIAIGSSVVPESLVTAVCKWGVPMIQIYGATETCPIAAYTPISDAARKPASTGKTALHCKIKLIDEQGQTVAEGDKGEILVRGNNIMSEYLKNPQATAEVFTDNWFHTGDVGHFDSEGFLYVDGRIKEIIISGGENLYPAAIEDVLSQNPEIMEVAVAGKPDNYWGEICVAVIVAMPDCLIDLEAIKTFCHEKIAHSSIPKKIILVDELPRNSMGKVIKKSLAELVEQSL